MARDHSRRLPTRLPWHPHTPLPALSTATVARLAHLADDRLLRLALLEELDRRAGSDRDPWSLSCSGCAGALA